MRPRMLRGPAASESERQDRPYRSPENRHDRQAREDPEEKIRGIAPGFAWCGSLSIVLRVPHGSSLRCVNRKMAATGTAGGAARAERASSSVGRSRWKRGSGERSAIWFSFG